MQFSFSSLEQFFSQILTVLDNYKNRFNIDQPIFIYEFQLRIKNDG